FRTGGNTTRMTLINSGYLGIGTATPGGQLELSLDEGRKPASSTWTITSDARLKNVTGDYHKGLTEIIALKPIRYNYKNTDKRTFEQDVLNKEAYGFLAQEVQTVFPEAVGVDDDGYLNFNLHPILIASINAFKELNTKYEEVKSENEALKDKLNALLVRVEALENQ
ncbi:MAG: tail fiber domain-containing protein, partial [Mangrovimonas sp.]|nr:tail fiber domain-containing protein [Mangrovimonas sp.]